MADSKLKGKQIPIRTAMSEAKSFVERVAKLFEEQKAISADVTEICDEAKEVAGLEPSMVRFAARESLIDASKRAERDEKRHRYLRAVGLAVAAVEAGEVSARQAAKIYSIGKTSVYNALAVREVSAPVEMTADDLGDPLWVVDKDRARFRDKVRAIASSVKVDVLRDSATPSAAEPQIDTLDIPSFLKGSGSLARRRAPPV